MTEDGKTPIVDCPECGKSKIKADISLVLKVEKKDRDYDVKITGERIEPLEDCPNCKKRTMIVVAPDVMQKYFEGGNDWNEEKIDELIQKCGEMKRNMRLTTPTSAFIHALKESSNIDGDRVKKFLQVVELMSED